MNYKNYYFSNEHFDNMFLPLVNDIGEICYWFDLILLNDDDTNQKMLAIFKERKVNSTLKLFCLIKDYEEVDKALFNLSKRSYREEKLIKRYNEESLRDDEFQHKFNILQLAVDKIEKREDTIVKNEERGRIIRLFNSLNYFLDLKNDNVKIKNANLDKQSVEEAIVERIFLINHFIGNKKEWLDFEQEEKDSVINACHIFKIMEKHTLNMGILAYLMLKINFSKYFKIEDLKIESQRANIKNKNGYIESILNKFNNHFKFLSKEEREDIFKYLLSLYAKEKRKIDKLSNMELVKPFLIEKEL